MKYTHLIKSVSPTNIALSHKYIAHSSKISGGMYNLGQNIWGHFHFLAQFFFTTSETELDCYHQKVSVRVASRVAERLKI